jgi:hypothetical protein
MEMIYHLILFQYNKLIKINLFIYLLNISILPAHIRLNIKNLLIFFSQHTGQFDLHFVFLIIHLSQILSLQDFICLI